MSKSIALTYDRSLNCWIISMPDSVTLVALEDFRERLFVSLSSCSEKTNLLIDTHWHRFESVACLKTLRDILEAPQVASKCLRAAFVAPRPYHEPQIVSDREAYFNEFDDAYAWLQSKIAK